jgi:superfamily I DNA/RNA helicase
MDFNLEQKKAVESTNNTILINAGPGTGKTKTLIGRINYLTTEKQVNPQNILAITFTKKAASEIKERLTSLGLNKVPYITTFHGFGYDILKKHNDELTLIEEEERNRLIKQIILSDDLQQYQTLNIRELSLFISNAKSSLNKSIHQNLLESYNKILADKNYIDFDDLLRMTYEFLRSNPTELQSLQTQYSYILIDEFQDTNPLQYELIKLFYSSCTNLFVIGDPFQSIYSFRGADSSIFDTFKNDFPNTEKITLNINYRSRTNIVTASNNVFQNQINLVAHSTESGKVTIVETLNEYTEADYILADIENKIGGSDLLKAGTLSSQEHVHAGFNDFAIIYRNHRLSDILRDKLKTSGIPFQIVGEGSVYEQPIIKCITSILTYMYTQDSIVFNHLKDNPYIVNKTLDTISSIQKNQKISQIISSIISQLSYPIEEENHLYQFKSIFHQFDKFENGLKQALAYLSYLEDNEYFDRKSERVTLLTMHAAKGLEFKYVYIIGFEESNVPATRKKVTLNIEEERRLFYVAITRAKYELCIICCQKRQGKEMKVSSFKQYMKDIIDIKDPYIDRMLQRQKKIKDKKSQMSLF